LRNATNSTNAPAYSTTRRRTDLAYEGALVRALAVVPVLAGETHFTAGFTSLVSVGLIVSPAAGEDVTHAGVPKGARAVTPLERILLVEVVGTEPDLAEVGGHEVEEAHQGAIVVSGVDRSEVTTIGATLTLGGEPRHIGGVVFKVTLNS